LYGFRCDIVFADWDGKLFPEAAREVKRRGDKDPLPLLNEWIGRAEKAVYLPETRPVDAPFAWRQDGYLYRLAPIAQLKGLPPSPEPAALFRRRSALPYPPDVEAEETRIMPLLAQARFLWIHKRREKALALLVEAREEGAHSAPALANTGILYYDMGEDQVGSQCMKRAHRLQPRYVESMFRK
jgi:hypothetical protein